MNAPGLALWHAPRLVHVAVRCERPVTDARSLGDCVWAGFREITPVYLRDEEEAAAGAAGGGSGGADDSDESPGGGYTGKL